MDFITLSHKGMVRPNNEDSVEAVRIVSSGPNGPFLDVLALILADGMGGAMAGEFASSLAIKTVKSDFLKNVLGQPPENLLHADMSKFLTDCFQQANSIIYQKSKENPDFQGMGTTIVTGIVYRDQLLMGHIGDSRGYLYRASVLEQVTHDHSMVQELVDRGELTRDAAFSHPNRNIITRAVGVDPFVEGEFKKVPLAKGDIVLLCSDGLCGLADDHAIEKIVRDFVGSEETNLMVLANRLIETANLLGGTDNVSVALYRHA